MFPTISETAVGSMVPSKTAVQTVKLVTHSEETVLVFVVDGEPLFVDNDGCIFPTGQDNLPIQMYSFKGGVTLWDF